MPALSFKYFAARIIKSLTGAVPANPGQPILQREWQRGECEPMGNPFQVFNRSVSCVAVVVVLVVVVAVVVVIVRAPSSSSAKRRRQFERPPFGWPLPGACIFIYIVSRGRISIASRRVSSGCK